MMFFLYFFFILAVQGSKSLKQTVWFYNEKKNFY